VRFAWLITCALLFAHSANAGGDDEAKRLFEDGRARAKEGKYAEACELFGKSLAIERKIVTELNLGECNEHLGHLRDAWGMYLAGAGDAAVDGDAKTATFGRERAAALEPQMTIVIVKVAQPKLNNLLITISGRATQPIAEIHERADPGDIEVIATAPGRPQIKLSKRGVAGGEMTFEIPRMDPNVPIETPEKLIPIDGARSTSRVRVAYALGIGGAASAIAAVTLTVIGREHYNTAANSTDCMKVTGGIRCNDTGTRAIHDAQHLADIGTVFAIGGAALLGSAAIVYLTAPRDQVFVRPEASSSGVSLVIGGVF
jgi:hypothetical protein